MDHADYQNFDFASADEELQYLGAKRGESPVFAEATWVLYFKAKDRGPPVHSLQVALARLTK